MIICDLRCKSLSNWYFEIKHDQVLLKIQFEFLDFNGQFIGTKKLSIHKDIYFLIYQKNKKNATTF